MNGKFIAHVRKNTDGTWSKPHLLSDHLKETAKIAGKFAAKFSSEEWGIAAGLAHDSGKGRLKWQNYLCCKSGYYDKEAHLENKPGKIPHAIHGAKLVEKFYGKGVGRILSYCIAGHHSGLPDFSSAGGAGQSSLEFQLQKTIDLDAVEEFVIKKIKSAQPSSPPRQFYSGLDMSFWIRMIYSCLVDADFLDTENYMDKEASDSRKGYLSILELKKSLQKFNLELEKTSEDTYVNQIRRSVRRKCLDMAKKPQGVFSLTVPTGGGKTLSSLAFALDHAEIYNLDRIIYVIPFTSIIEQNANVFRKVFGNDQVVEHHSSINEEDITPKTRLAAENWDAPIVVTTSVQFFESLFAAKSSRCRKLHNIANSVVVLDEAQLVPVEYLAPILETLQLLVEHYKVSCVFSTATQPAFGNPIALGKKKYGLKNIREIIGDESDIKKLFGSLKRVDIHLPEDYNTVKSWENIAEELQQYNQVLCIVSDRKSCRELHKLMPEGTFHLSALMCGEHRSKTIKKIKEKLQNDEMIRVISTQIVEAGVDIDFPVVYRALAGLDSIAQAAGRCNREGKLLEPGKVVIFIPPKKAPIGILRKAADTALIMLAADNNKDLLDGSIYQRYFFELYGKANSIDSKDILSLLKPEKQNCGIYFRTAAEKFRIIDDSKQKSILIPYGEGSKFIELLKFKGPDRGLNRKLQRYAVNVYNYDFTSMLLRGSLEEVYPNIYALSSSIEYSENIGLLIEETLFDPEDLIL